MLSGIQARRVRCLTPACAFLISSGLAAGAQSGKPIGYEVTETNVSSPQIAADNVGPVRMVRFSVVQGPVSCRPTPKLKWSRAAINEPIRQGCQVFVPARSRAELYFDDGSVMRLGGGAFVTMQTLYSDDKGEFTEVKLNDGLATCRLKNRNSLYQVDTPFCSVKAAGPARFRCGFRNSVEIADQDGNLTVEDPQDTENLAPGQFAVLRDPNSPIIVSALPPDDSWEQWNHNRDRIYDHGSPISRRYLPADLYLAEPDLDDYGSWYDEPHYGHVWVPRIHEAGWRPYHHGHWVWVDPFGWTWVGDEPWGWAPYHYGTWAHTRHGWAWCPGPEQQYWSPAVVSFSSYDDDIAWAPLSPDEVRYPSRLAVSFSDGDWALQFSIGGTAAYYPGPNHLCVARAWDTNYVNQATYVTNYYGYGGRPLYAANYNTYLGSGSWTPRNALYGGGSRVAASQFATAGSFAPVYAGNTAAFQRGRPVGAPARGFAPAMGPSHVRPTFASMTPTRAFNAPSPSGSIVSRRMFRANIDPRIARVAPAFGSQTLARTQRRGGRMPGAGFAASNNARRPGGALVAQPRQATAHGVPASPGALVGRSGRINNGHPAMGIAGGRGRALQAAHNTPANAARTAVRASAARQILGNAHMHRTPGNPQRVVATTQHGGRAVPSAAHAPRGLSGHQARVAHAGPGSFGRQAAHRPQASPRPVQLRGGRQAHPQFSRRTGPPAGGGHPAPSFSRRSGPPVGGGNPAPHFSRRSGPAAGAGNPMPRFSRRSGPPAWAASPTPHAPRRSGPPAGGNPMPQVPHRGGPPAGGGNPGPQFSHRGGPPAGGGGGRVARPQPAPGAQPQPPQGGQPQGGGEGRGHHRGG